MEIIMNRNVVFCFSGTGNSLHCAMTIAEHLENTDVILIKESTKGYDASNAECIGFVFPVYYWTMPTFIKEYIQTLSLNSNAYYFVVATSAGLFVNTLNDLEKELNQKGVSLSYSNKLRMVANYVAEYEPFPKVEPTLKRANSKLHKIASDIAVHRTNKPVNSNVFKNYMRKIPLKYSKDLESKDSGFRISDECISCNLCQNICPRENIKMNDGKPTFLHHCSQCMACIVYCPKYAINYQDKTQNRTKYHYPDVSAQMLCQSKIEFNKK